MVAYFADMEEIMIGDTVKRLISVTQYHDTSHRRCHHELKPKQGRS